MFRHSSNDFANVLTALHVSEGIFYTSGVKTSYRVDRLNETLVIETCTLVQESFYSLVLFKAFIFSSAYRLSVLGFS